VTDALQVKPHILQHQFYNRSTQAGRISAVRAFNPESRDKINNRGILAIPQKHKVRRLVNFLYCCGIWVLSKFHG
jgi:hypothetical protein